MDIHKFRIIEDTIFECLHSSGTFKRAIPDIPILEVNDIMKDNKRWIVFAAGIGPIEANELFAGDNKRKERSKLPLLSNNDTSVSIKLIIRPFESESISIKELPFVTAFAPKRGLPLIELRSAKIKFEGIPKNDHGLQNLRWDFDPINSFNEPVEKWLISWYKDIGFNPVHCYSHLHMNYTPISETENNKRAGDAVSGLRLTVGTPNPISLILSLSTWLGSF
jgi:hypothetical protein